MVHVDFYGDKSKPALGEFVRLVSCEERESDADDILTVRCDSGLVSQVGASEITHVPDDELVLAMRDPIGYLKMVAFSDAGKVEFSKQLVQDLFRGK